MKDEIYTHLENIVGPKHRSPSNPEAEKKISEVENYIISTFRENGWDVTEQIIEIKEMKTAWGEIHQNLKGKNIIASRSSDRDKPLLIIAAHHDTVPESMGADDDGSGIVGLLHYSRIFKDVETDYGIMLVSFDFEEIGLVGSEYFVQNLESLNIEPKQIVGVLVLEMLGYYSTELNSQFLPSGFDKLYRSEVNQLSTSEGIKGDFLAIVFNGKSKKIRDSFKKFRGEHRMALLRHPTDIPLLGKIIKSLVPSISNMLRSDHTPFWYRKIPAVMITDTANFRNPHYHLPTDTIDTLDLQGLKNALKLIEKVILDLVNLI